MSFAQDDVNFSRDVLPILSDHCFQCHGPDANEGRKGDLRLDDEQDVKRNRDGDFVVKPGDVEHSLLAARINSSDPDELMPPPELNRPLSKQKIAILNRWIAEGARWGKHWTFERIERPAANSAAKIHPIDQFVDGNISSAGLTSNPAADRRTLIRRLSLDLTGLPPAPAAVDAFLADTKPGAWERLVDRTLASPAYGERMAWDWLDAARYADTNGYQGDRERTMWPWRDWVVNAFNKNLPYDKFTVWQLAGDLLPNATDEQILATGFNRNHMINGEGGRIAEENRVDYVFDMTETMGTVWLGLTLNCCRCHDHKFDPLTQREYFQFTAFFNQTPVNGGGGDPQTPPVLAVPSPSNKKELARLESTLSSLKEKIAGRRKTIAPQQANWEATALHETKPDTWTVMNATQARAKEQTLELLTGGLIYATGKNPDKDEYEVEYAPQAGDITGFRLDAIRHPKMTAGGLARSDSGNFVLTDISFELKRNGGNAEGLKIASAEATYEQGSLKIESAFDNNPVSGWAVYEGRPLDKDHSAVLRLAKSVRVQPGDTLLVRLKFNSPYVAHNLGHFRIARTSVKAPGFDGQESLLADLKTPIGKRSKEQKQRIQTAFEAADDVLAKFRAEQTRLQRKADSIRKSSPKVMVMRDLSKRRSTKILERGLYNQPKDEEVTANVPAFLPTLPVASESNPANRLDLARWLVSRDHPLTARVTVNRFWQMLFGMGLVKTVEDFGVQGEYPVQRELLDWLAVEFMESGWDVKHLLKTIVTSDTYQRSSALLSRRDYEQDPENRLFARGPRYRLPSWMIRDQALAASGLLNPARGGRSVYSYQPDGIWSEATFGKKKYSQDKGDALYRRSLYTYWRRIVGPTMFFDTAKRQVCDVKTKRTNTPMHALNTLNSVTYVEAARSLAVRTLQAEEETVPRLQFASRRILSRELSVEEIGIFENSLERSSQAFAGNEESAVEFLKHGNFQAPAEITPVECAVWTALCLNLLNLDETLNRE